MTLELWVLSLMLCIIQENSTSMQVPSPGFLAIVGVNSSILMFTLSAEQVSHPELSVCPQLFTNLPGIWNKFPQKRYRQLWSKLLLQDSVTCCKVKSQAMSDAWLLRVVSPSQQKTFLTLAHDNSGH